MSQGKMGAFYMGQADGTMKVRCYSCKGTGMIEVPDGQYGLVKEIAEVLEETAAKHEITVEMLCSDRRTNRLVRARREAGLQLRELGLSLKEIGYHLGGRDHSTIHTLIGSKKRG